MENVLKIISYAKISHAPEIDPILRKRLKKLLILFRSDDAIGNIFRQAQENGFIELPSMFSNRNAKCSFNIYSADKNFLRFVDQNGQRFYVVQNPRYFLHSVYLPDEQIIFSKISSKPQIMQMLRAFQNNLKIFDDIDSIEKNHRFLGIINGYPRPYHYFRDKITTLLFLRQFLTNIPILTLQDQAFLRADLINNTPEVMISGSLNTHLVQNQGFALDSGGSFSPSYRNNMDVAAASIGTEVYKKFEKSDLAALLNDCSPVIWFGICSQKRTWLNQNSVIAEIINSIVDTYPDALFVFDGLTATVGVDEVEFRNTVAAREVKDLEDIINRVNGSEKFKYLSLIGAHAEKKIFAGSKVDFFLSSALTDSIWTAHFNRKRGLAYLSTVANSDEHSHPKTYITPSSYVQDETHHAKNWSTVNYYLDSEYIRWSFINGLAQWMQQKKVGDMLYPLAMNDRLPVSIVPLTLGGFRLECEYDEGQCEVYSVGDSAKNYNRTAQALKCLAKEYDFLIDAVCSGSTSLELMVVGYGAGNRAEQLKVDINGGELRFSEEIDRFRVFLKVAGKGSIDFYGYRAQPRYPEH